MRNRVFFRGILLFCLVCAVVLPVTAQNADDEEVLPLRNIKLSDVPNIKDADFPVNDWEDFNFRLYDPKQILTSENIHVIWAGNYDEFQIIVYDHNFEPVFEIFHPRYVRYACGGGGCHYWIHNIPHEIIESGPFFLQVEGTSFSLNSVRYSRVLGFEMEK